MRVEDFDFDLPEDRIALRPASPRDSSRLLVVRENGSREHRTMQELPELLRAGDCLVVNDTRVIPARLMGRRLGRDPTGAGAGIEVMLHKRVSPSSFRALARPAKRLKPGDRIRVGQTLEGVIAARDGGEIEIIFEKEGAALDAAIASEGEVPLPPYIAGKRKPDPRDAADYQTVYAERPGSVAAPTAGLHFTPELLARLGEKHIACAHVTLHVGAGTFLPVTAEDTADHKMHAEWAELSPHTARILNDTRAAGGRIVAVGTTALRTLETAADDSGRIHPFSGDTALFITPGYRFKCVDVLLTNFHLPRSTLFMLVSAFSGTKTMKAAYAEAIAARYRFYSYGDACLLFRVRA
ncbi:MAG TPA: tRNA preQ1(34) S-adenosylmethionine ribosyltransferase-isomerase QueA [Micropepsaceae bacterium]|jgi:S-adenosylmethionine:tRNA ribosyltransferase-isomerase|nr:tRNA preQ1(34) S-adenosylmethionine ribosyltransferase-isomerase QueA [Micropepsaceae bacterium]